MKNKSLSFLHKLKFNSINHVKQSYAFPLIESNWENLN